MTALANSLRRIWSAKNRVLRLTGWGTSGSRETAADDKSLVRWARARLRDLVAAAQRNAPTVIVVTLNIFR
jgi:hypothetical protein